jgi:hypothetical protein
LPVVHGRCVRGDHPKRMTEFTVCIGKDPQHIHLDSHRHPRESHRDSVSFTLARLAPPSRQPGSRRHRYVGGGYVGLTAI